MFACSHRSTARTRTVPDRQRRAFEFAFDRIDAVPPAQTLGISGAADGLRHRAQRRLRKYYRITPAGVTYLDEFLKDWDDVLDVYEYVKRGANR